MNHANVLANPCTKATWTQFLCYTKRVSKSTPQPTATPNAHAERSTSRPTMPEACGAEPNPRKVWNKPWATRFGHEGR